MKENKTILAIFLWPKFKDKKEQNNTRKIMKSEFPADMAEGLGGGGGQKVIRKINFSF